MPSRAFSSAGMFLAAGQEWYFSVNRIFIRRKAYLFNANAEKTRFFGTHGEEKAVFPPKQEAEFGWLHKIFAAREFQQIFCHLWYKMVFLTRKRTIFRPLCRFFFTKSMKKPAFRPDEGRRSGRKKRTPPFVRLPRKKRRSLCKIAKNKPACIG